MKDYEKHVRSERLSNEHGHAMAYCGERITMEFHFVNAEHALSNAQANGRLIPCRKCKKRMIELLNWMA